MRLRASDAPFAILAAAGLALAALVVAEASYSSFSKPLTVDAETGSGSETRAQRPAEPTLGESRAALSPPPPSAIAARFGGGGRAGVRAGGRASETAPSRARLPAGPAERADWLRAVCGFEDSDGCAWIVVKDEREGRAIKLRVDGAQAAEGRLVRDAAGSLVLEREGRRFAIAGR